jgi:hypothetical protein
MRKLKIKMNLSMVRRQFKRSGVEIFKEERLPNDMGPKLLRPLVMLSTFMTMAQSTTMARIQRK